jgi:hypothetical protein
MHLDRIIMHSEEGERVLLLGCGSKNSDVFLGKDLGEGSEEIQKAKMVVWIEGGSCSFNENREKKCVVLVAFKGDSHSIPSVY